MTQKLIAYKRMPIWTKDTMPEALQRSTIPRPEPGERLQF